MPDSSAVHNMMSGVVFGNIVQARDIVVSSVVAPAAVAGLPVQPILVGRDVDLARLYVALAPDASGEAVASPGVVVVAGLPGVGKTALAVRAAHQAVDAGWFPGGVIMIDLRGYDPSDQRVSATTALAGVLESVGVDARQVPTTQEARERLWRSVLTSRDRMLIVADNVSVAEQVRPLLPGTGRHRLLVTSRHSLSDLQGARLLELDVLSSEQGVSLLRRELTAACSDDRRVQTDMDAAKQLVELCAGLPLALRIVSALLTSEPEKPLGKLVGTLTDENRRLDELEYNESLAVRAAFDLSYQQLTEPQARLFRLMGLNPGPDISTDALAALSNTDEKDVRKQVAKLRRAHLVMPAVSADSTRWRMHDLLRLYAVEYSSRELDQSLAIERLLEYYLCATRKHQYGTDWLDTEYNNLVGAIILADSTERHNYTLGLSKALRYYFGFRSRWSEWLTAYRLALTAAIAIGDRSSEIEIANDLGIAYRMLGQYEDAIEVHQDALQKACALSDYHGQIYALDELGQNYRELGNISMSVEYHERALGMCQDLNWHGLEAGILVNLGSSYMGLARDEEALERFQQALQISHEIGDHFYDGSIWDNLGLVNGKLRRWQEALNCHLVALKIARDLDDRYGIALALDNAATAYGALGYPKESRQCWEEALLIFIDLPGSSAQRVARGIQAALEEEDDGD